jgi:hypothetical protein
MGEKRNVYRVLMGKPELDTALGRLAQMEQEHYICSYRTRPGGHALDCTGSTGWDKWQAVVSKCHLHHQGGSDVRTTLMIETKNKSLKYYMI